MSPSSEKEFERCRQLQKRWKVSPRKGTAFETEGKSNWLPSLLFDVNPFQVVPFSVGAKADNDSVVDQPESEFMKSTSNQLIDLSVFLGVNPNSFERRSKRERDKKYHHGSRVWKSPRFPSDRDNIHKSTYNNWSRQHQFPEIPTRPGGSAKLESLMSLSFEPIPFEGTSPSSFSHPCSKKRKLTHTEPAYLTHDQKLDMRAQRFANPRHNGDVKTSGKTQQVMNDEGRDNLKRKVPLKQRQDWGYSNPDTVPPPLLTKRCKKTARRRLPPPINPYRLRPVVIDGCNVAYSFGDRNGNRIFDCQGLRICVNYFASLGCKDITVVIPEAKLENKAILNRTILDELKDERILHTSISRKLHGGNWVSPYDDRFILEVARVKGAVVVSNDKFRDLIHENELWVEIILKRVLHFRFIHSKEASSIYFPPDPFGRNGKSMNEIIQFPWLTQKV